MYMYLYSPIYTSQPINLYLHNLVVIVIVKIYIERLGDPVLSLMDH